MAAELPPDTGRHPHQEHMVGGRMEALFPGRKPFREATVLQVRGLTRADVDASFRSCVRARSSVWLGWSARVAPSCYA